METVSTIGTRTLVGRNSLAGVTIALACASVSCASPPLRVRGGLDAKTYVSDDGQGPDVGAYRFRPIVCDGVDMKPEYGAIDETSLQQLLQRAGVDLQIERPRGDLTYFVVRANDLEEPVRLRVAILKNAEDASNDLYQALLEHGTGSWGVHRGNIAVLGPAASASDAMIFAARTRLACWGTFTVTGTDDVFVIPGGYAEP